jgi:2-dehydropantoate 2-reductase
VTDDIGHVECEKLLQIARWACWSVSTVGLGTYDVAEVLQIRAAAEHYVVLGTELLAIYTAMGYAPEDFFAPFSDFCDLQRRSFEDSVDAAVALGIQMRSAGNTGRPSLHDDLLNGRPTEAEVLVAPFLREADDAGVDVATVRAAYRVMSAIEELRGANARIAR